MKKIFNMMLNNPALHLRCAFLIPFLPSFANLLPAPSQNSWLSFTAEHQENQFAAGSGASMEGCAHVNVR